MAQHTHSKELAIKDFRSNNQAGTARITGLLNPGGGG
jgi:hypothetical protein